MSSSIPIPFNLGTFYSSQAQVTPVTHLANSLLFWIVTIGTAYILTIGCCTSRRKKGKASAKKPQGNKIQKPLNNLQGRRAENKRSNAKITRLATDVTQTIQTIADAVPRLGKTSKKEEQQRLKMPEDETQDEPDDEDPEAGESQEMLSQDEEEFLGDDTISEVAGKKMPELDLIDWFYTHQPGSRDNSIIKSNDH